MFLISGLKGVNILMKIKLIALVIIAVTCLASYAIRIDVFKTVSTESIQNDNQIDMNKLKEEYPEYFNMSYSNGIEIYVWQMAEECYRCGMINVNGNRTSDEIYALQSKSLSVEETKAILAEIGISKDDIIIIPISQPYSSYFYEIDEAYKDKVIKLFE